jgi:hypothetical protein
MKWGVDMFYYLLFGSIVLLSFVAGFLGKKFIQHLDTVTTFGFYDFKLDEFDKFEVIFTALSIKNSELKEKILKELNNFTEDEIKKMGLILENKTLSQNAISAISQLLEENNLLNFFESNDFNDFLSKKNFPKKNVVDYIKKCYYDNEIKSFDTMCSYINSYLKSSDLIIDKEVKGEILSNKFKEIK